MTKLHERRTRQLYAKKTVSLRPVHSVSDNRNSEDRSLARAVLARKVLGQQEGDQVLTELRFS